MKHDCDKMRDSRNFSSLSQLIDLLSVEKNMMMKPQNIGMS